jgi:BirA family biotin operon repressor/biotin-[acetyl-CoA-carboxylase] ligase
MYVLQRYSFLSLFLLNKSLKLVNIYIPLMHIIKLDAIDSTNDYLKQLVREKELKNYTVVMAHEQTKGKGQLGAKWISEPGKNLTMSVLIKDLPQDLITVFDINAAVAVAMAKLLSSLKLDNVFVKWPNDIMADEKKIAGILIENILKPDGTFTAIVGIGLNVNQTIFKGLPDATSIKILRGTTYESLGELVIAMVNLIETYVTIARKNHHEIWELYNHALFKKNLPMLFVDSNEKRFIGQVKHVNKAGKLALLRDDKELHFYEAKEIKMLF